MVSEIFGNDCLACVRAHAHEGYGGKMLLKEVKEELCFVRQGLLIPEVFCARKPAGKCLVCHLLVFCPDANLYGVQLIQDVKLCYGYPCKAVVLDCAPGLLKVEPAASSYPSCCCSELMALDNNMLPNNIVGC